MRRREGITLLEVLALAFVIGVVVLVVTALPRPNMDRALRVECTSNVRIIVGLLEFFGRENYPEDDGPNLILYLVKRGELDGEDQLRLLFCPTDTKESFERAGGVTAYGKLDLEPRKNGHLTSYAGRRMTDPACFVKKGSQESVVLVADDSDDHHDGRGFVVGISGGAVRWRDKVEDYGLKRSTKVVVGPDSVVAELRCLSPE